MNKLPNIKMPKIAKPAMPRSSKVGTTLKMPKLPSMGVGKQLMMKKHEKKHKKHKNWIKGAIKHPGALHAELGVKKDTKIPASKLAKAAKKGGVEGKRARLAETLKRFHKRKSKMHEKEHKKEHEKMHKMHRKVCMKHKLKNCYSCE